MKLWLKSIAGIAIIVKSIIQIRAKDFVLRAVIIKVEPAQKDQTYPIGGLAKIILDGTAVKLSYKTAIFLYLTLNTHLHIRIVDMCLNIDLL